MVCAGDCGCAGLARGARVSACPSGKVQYPDRQAANEAALSWALKDLRRLGAAAVNQSYRCPTCGFWHRTSKGRGRN